MKFRQICFLLSVLAFLSCASLDTGRYYDDKSCCFISNYPQFKVQIKDKSAKPVETNMKITDNYAFTTNKGAIIIEILTLPHRNMDYYYPDEAIVSNLRGVPIGIESFNDKNWVRAVFFLEGNRIQTSYFRRQDKYLLGVSYSEHHPEQSSHVENYKKTLKLSQDLEDQIEKQFATANSTFEILE